MAESPRFDEVVALVVSPKKGALLLDVGLTRIYELINAGEIESFRAGKSRKIVLNSLKTYVARQLAAEATKQRSEWTKRATEGRAAKRSRSRHRTGSGS